MRKFAFLILFFIILNGCGSNIEIKEKQTTVPSSETDSYVENTLAGIVITFTDSNNEVPIPVFIMGNEGEIIWNHQIYSKLLTIYLVSDEFQNWVHTDWLFNYGTECKIRDSRTAFDEWIKGSNFSILKTDDFTRNIYIDDNSVSIINKEKVEVKELDENYEEIIDSIFNKFIEITDDGDVKEIIQKSMDNYISGE